jgi:putative ABC transport system permease protein
VVSERSGPGLRWAWWRLAWRDARAHWVAILAIALVLAIGSGVYTGLGSTGTWRRESNDASFAALAMHDLRVELSPGTFVDEGTLLDAVRSIDVASAVDAAVERLVVPSQVDSSVMASDLAGSAPPVLVPARLVGMSFDAEQPVDAVWIRDGSLPDGGDGLAGILEIKFAEQRGLPPQGRLAVAGAGVVTYTGLGMSPEDFFYEGPEGTVFAQGELAILYVPLATGQALAGRGGQVNDVVLTMADPEARSTVQVQLEEVLDDLGLSATITTREDADAVRVLYEDIDNDQRFWNTLSGLILGAATLAAFNLISRIVEAQRREIGIGMALGVPRRQLAVRPLVIGLQIAVLGTAAGIGVGLMVGSAFGSLMESLLPLPDHRTPFQTGVYARGAALGVAVPLLASALPVWRAVRVEPIEAIRTGHLTATSGRFTDWTRHLRLPGSSLTQMPLRNALRTPRRTLLTALGVASAITALVAVLGLLDSFGRALDQADRELAGADPDRVTVQLDTFYPIDSPVVESIAARPEVAQLDAGLRLPATAVGADDRQLDLLVEVVDFDGAIWTPSRDRLVAGAEESDAPGIVIADKASVDLGIEPGQTVRLRHPAVRPDGTFTLTESEFLVEAIHANPMRAFAFVDAADADVFGLAATTNLLHAYPGADGSPAELQRGIFDLPGVASSQPVARISQAIDEALEQFTGFLYITSAAVLVLALLIAFNATRIAVEERRRDHATMRAFGLPLRSVIAVVIKESVLVGAAATVLGLVFGTVFLGWMLSSLAETTLPDVSIGTYISPTTVVIAAVVGIFAVAAAPVFLIGKLRRMNVPDTLRVME